MKQLGSIATLSVTVTVAVVIVLASVIMVALYFFYPGLREPLTFLAAVAGGAAVIYTGYYAGASVHLAVIQSRKEKAFAILGELNKIDMATIRILIEKELANRSSLSPADLYQKILGDEKLLGAITTLLGLFEDTSIAAQQSYADERVLYLSLCFLVPWAYDGLRDYIKEERTRNDPTLYIELEKLAEAWKNKRSVRTGESLV